MHVRFVYKLAVGVVLALVALIVVALLLRQPIEDVCAARMERALAFVFDAKVGVQACSIAPLAHAVELRGVTVANPTGFAAGEAITFARIRAEVRPTSVFSSAPELTSVLVEGARFNIRHELGAGVNLQRLVDNAARLADPAAPNASQERPSGVDRRFVIRAVTVRSAQVELSTGVAPFAALKSEVPAATFTGLFGEEPVTIGEAFRRVLVAVLNESLSVKGLTRPLADALRREASPEAKAQPAGTAPSP